MLEHMKKKAGEAARPSDRGPDPAASPLDFVQAASAGESRQPIDLEDGIRRRMESHFGLDFGKVCLAQSDLPGKMGVDAIAQGDLIRFAPGAYRPETSAGEQLLTHELGHVIQQSRMGSGLGGLPIYDPASESGADAIAAGAMSRSGGMAVQSFSPAPAAQAPMEGGRFGTRVRQSANRFFFGKLGSWWRRRRNKDAVRDQVLADADETFRESIASDYERDARREQVQDLSNAMAEYLGDSRFDGSLWHGGNPLREHPEYYPEALFPADIHRELAELPDGTLTPDEIRRLQGDVGSGTQIRFMLEEGMEDFEAGMFPNLYRMVTARRSRIEPTWPVADRPENIRIWNATAAQLGGSASDPFDDGILGVQQERIDMAQNVDDVQEVLDKLVLGHTTTGNIGGNAQEANGKNSRDMMDLQLVKDRAKILALVAQHFPDIKQLITAHSGTDDRPDAEMYVKEDGTLGWNSSAGGYARRGLLDRIRIFFNQNSKHPFNSASLRHSTAHEAGHLVERAVTKKAFRARRPLPRASPRPMSKARMPTP